MGAETQGPTVTTVSVIFGVITILTISLRLFARVYITKSFGPDDGELRLSLVPASMHLWLPCLNAS